MVKQWHVLLCCLALIWAQRTHAQVDLDAFKYSEVVPDFCGDSENITACKTSGLIQLRSRIFDASKTKTIKFYTTLQKKTEYTITVCRDQIENRDVIIKLFNKRGEYLLSSYAKSTKIFHDRITFIPYRSGVFFVKIYLKKQKDENGRIIENNASGCGAVILEMNEQPVQKKK